MSSCENIGSIQTLFNTGNFEEWSFNAHKILEEIEKYFDRALTSIKERKMKLIDPDSFIHPTAVLENDIIIGKNVYIGPFSYIKNHSIILSGTKIGYNVEIIKSIIMPNSKISHMACIGNSLIGSDCNLGAGFIVTTRRLNSKKIEIKVPPNTNFYSKRRHHGVVVGSNVQTGVNVIIMPGSTIGENAVIYPKSTVSGYVKPNFSGFIKAKWEK